MNQSRVIKNYSSPARSSRDKDKKTSKVDESQKFADEKMGVEQKKTVVVVFFGSCRLSSGVVVFLQGLSSSSYTVVESYGEPLVL